jgi:hypothetical protein
VRSETASNISELVSEQGKALQYMWIYKGGQWYFNNTANLNVDINYAFALGGTQTPAMVNPTNICSGIIRITIVRFCTNRIKKGASYKDIRNHVYIRALLMLLLGWWLYCIEPEEINLKNN